MRIAIVFSSPNQETEEYYNIWRRCPQGKEISAGQVLIEDKDWQIHVFDGRRSIYSDGLSWNLDSLVDRINAIIQAHADTSVAILLHGGSDQEVNAVNAFCNEKGIACPLCEAYSSYTGTFYDEVLVPFASDGAGKRFEALWHNLLRNDSAKEVDTQLDVELRFMKHRFCNITTFMSSKINMAEKRGDRDLLLKFDKADIGTILQKFKSIEPDLTRERASGIEDVRRMLEDLIENIYKMKAPELCLDEVLKLARDCNEKSDSLYQVFKGMTEENHGR